MCGVILHATEHRDRALDHSNNVSGHITGTIDVYCGCIPLIEVWHPLHIRIYIAICAMRVSPLELDRG
jgi:hypothetical protein